MRKQTNNQLQNGGNMNKNDCNFLAEILENVRYQNPNAEKFFGLTAIDKAIGEITDYIEEKLGTKTAHQFYTDCIGGNQWKSNMRYIT